MCATPTPYTHPMTDPAARPTRVMALMNQKGGVGKTTTTVNLAAALARRGRRALLIDLDPQAHATIHLGYEPSTDPNTHAPSVYDLLLDPDTDPAATVHPSRDNLELIPAETDLAAAETDLPSAHRPQFRLRDALDRLLSARPADQRPEFILLDCPPSLGMLTINALVAAREVFVPMQAHFLALQGLGKLLETVSMLRGSPAQPGLNPKLRVSGVFLCMHDRQATHTQEVVADLDGFFEQARTDAAQTDGPLRYARVYRPAIRRNIKLAECPSFGQTIFDYAPDANGAADYADLADTILKEWDRALASRPQQPAVAVNTDATRDTLNAHTPESAQRSA